MKTVISIWLITLVSIIVGIYKIPEGNLRIIFLSVTPILLFIYTIFIIKDIINYYNKNNDECIANGLKKTRTKRQEDERKLIYQSRHEGEDVLPSQRGLLKELFPIERHIETGDYAMAKFRDTYNIGSEWNYLGKTVWIVEYEGRTDGVWVSHIDKYDKTEKKLITREKIGLLKTNIPS